MKQVSIEDAKVGLSNLVEAVQKGERVEIIRDGKAVAVLSRADAPPDKLTDEQIARRREAFRRLEEHAKQMDPGDLDWKAAVEEGRR